MFHFNTTMNLPDLSVKPEHASIPNKGGHVRYLGIIFSALCLTLILLCANHALLNQIPNVQNPDEIIPLRVLQHMQQTLTLNTDWDIEGLPDYFRRVHFNFSGYLLAAHTYVTAVEPAAIGNDLLLLARLREFSKLAALGLIFVVFFCVRRMWGNGYAILAATAVSTAPILFQDAHYARPEAFGTLLFTTCFALATCPGKNVRSNAIRIALILVLSGFLASIKITYLSATLFCLPLVQPYLGPYISHGTVRTRACLLTGLVAAGLLALFAGFAMGAPHAIANPGLYWDGIEALREQYKNIHPPHSLGHWSWFGQLGYMASYFGATLGFPFLALHCLGYAAREARGAVLAYLLITIATITFFATQHVFFERNLSHLAPIFLVLAVGGIRALVNLLQTRITAAYMQSVLMAVATLVLFVVAQITPVHISRTLSRYFSVDEAASRQRNLQSTIDSIIRSTGARRVVSVGYPDVFRSTLAEEHECVLYQVATYGDYWSHQFLAALPANIAIANIIPSVFKEVPTSTLQTYHSPTIYLLYDHQLCNAKTI